MIPIATIAIHYIEFVNLQPTDQVKMRLTSKLIEDILILLQQLLEHCNGNVVLTFFYLPSAEVLPVIFISYFYVASERWAVFKYYSFTFFV